jgi:hypothetical protein
MKSVIAAFLLVIVLAGSLSAQMNQGSKGFVIKQNSEPAKETSYKTAISAADLENYRLRDNDVTLHFEEGFDCVLYSAKSLFIKGLNINANDYKTSFSTDFILPVFSISASGILIAKYDVLDKSKSKTIVK